MKNNGKLFHVQEPEETEKIWKYHTNSSTQFIAKHILPDTGQNSIERDMLSKPTVDIVYSEYLRYCTLRNQTPELNNRFNNAMIKENYQQFTTTENKRAVKKWRNVILKRIEDRVIESEPTPTKGLVEFENEKK